tara:strand:- start:1943 stop:2773 length:831 start_codon:yes stop_codon:yes gene_type:complete
MTGVVLLTGATGFVGRQVLRVLFEKGVRVRLVTRAENFNQIKNYGTFEKVIYTSDLFSENSDWWAEACQGIDVVIHVAWYAEPGKYLQSPFNLDCLVGTLMLSKGAAQAGVRRFIGIGTCFEYDLSGGWLSVQTSLEPASPYGSAKAAAFIALNHLLPIQAIEFAWCRLFYLYGEGEDKRRLVPYLRSQLIAGEPVELSSGDQIRDFMDVSEAAKMIVDVALGREQGPINICSGLPVTIRQLAEQIADEYKRRDLLRFGVRLNNPLDPPCVVGIRQ